MTNQPNTTPATKPQPVLVFGAVTTFLTVFFGGITLVAGLQENKTVALVAGIGTLVTAGLNQAKDFYVRGRVTPTADVLAYLNENRQVITGPATKGPVGVPAVVEPRPDAIVNPVETIDPTTVSEGKI